MANIRVDVNYTIKDGSKIVFRSPVDCSAITGLVVYYPAEDGTAASKEFVLADAHGHDVGNIDHLFAENVIVKVILDVTSGMAYVQNADTNAYIEKTFIKSFNGVKPDPETGDVKIPIQDDNGVSSEQVKDIIEEYFEENPIEKPKDGYYRIEASIMDGNVLRIDHKASNTDMVGLPTQFVKIPAGLPIPATAEVGQYIVVSAVDENGAVTATEAVDTPTGGGGVSMFAARAAGRLPEVVEGYANSEFTLDFESTATGAITE